MSLITLAIDAMGGDFGPPVTIPAAVDFLNRHNFSHRIILVGDAEEIENQLKLIQAEQLLANGHISIKAASQVVEMDESPSLALRNKKDSSMRVAINQVKEGEAQAAISAGNTGALMATARFVLKTIKGISRPAIISSMPCDDPSKSILMLDLGANIDSSPEMLSQFAAMGSVMAEEIDGKTNPSVALLNVGAEEIKGSEKVKKAAQEIAASQVNYVGYIESDEIYTGKVDVVVCDGFEGNVALKASEGTAKIIFKVLKEEFKRSMLTKLMGLVARSVLKRVQSRLDPRLHNGATLIGLNGVVVKSHGGTDIVGFVHAIEEAALQAERSLTERISAKIESLLH